MLNLTAGGARLAYVRGKAAREKILEKRGRAQDNVSDDNSDEAFAIKQTPQSADQTSLFEAVPQKSSAQKKPEVEVPAGKHDEPEMIPSSLTSLHNQVVIKQDKLRLESDIDTQSKQKSVQALSVVQRKKTIRRKMMMEKAVSQRAKSEVAMREMAEDSDTDLVCPSEIFESSIELPESLSADCLTPKEMMRCRMIAQRAGQLRTGKAAEQAVPQNEIALHLQAEKEAFKLPMNAIENVKDALGRIEESTKIGQQKTSPTRHKRLRQLFVRHAAQEKMLEQEAKGGAARLRFNVRSIPPRRIISGSGSPYMAVAHSAHGSSSWYGRLGSGVKDTARKLTAAFVGGRTQSSEIHSSHACWRRCHTLIDGIGGSGLSGRRFTDGYPLFR